MNGHAVVDAFKVKGEGWTVYQQSSDEPGRFAARKSRLYAGHILVNPDIVTAETLDELRRRLPPGLKHFQRAPETDSSIVEFWV